MRPACGLLASWRWSVQLSPIGVGRGAASQSTGHRRISPMGAGGGCAPQQSRSGCIPAIRGAGRVAARRLVWCAVRKAASSLLTEEDDLDDVAWSDFYGLFWDADDGVGVGKPCEQMRWDTVDAAKAFDEIVLGFGVAH